MDSRPRRSFRNRDDRGRFRLDWKSNRNTTKMTIVWIMMTKMTKKKKNRYCDCPLWRIVVILLLLLLLLGPLSRRWILLQDCRRKRPQRGHWRFFEIEIEIEIETPMKNENENVNENVNSNSNVNFVASCFDTNPFSFCWVGRKIILVFFFNSSPILWIVDCRFEWMQKQ